MFRPPRCPNKRWPEHAPPLERERDTQRDRAGPRRRAQGLEDEPEDESKSAALEHQIENELCERGTSCGATDSRASVLEHVTERAVATFEMHDRHAAKGDDIATELQNLCDPLRAANSAAAPFVIGCQPAHPGRRCSVIVGRC